MIRFLHAKGSSPTKFHHETVLDFSQDGVKKRREVAVSKKIVLKIDLVWLCLLMIKTCGSPILSIFYHWSTRFFFFYVITINEVSFL